jgi:hypothetical protein
MTKYIYFEDFVGMLVGPFHSQADIDAHIKFCEDRGDAADVVEIVDFDSERFHKLLADNDTMTPEEDRNFKFD